MFSNLDLLFSITPLDGPDQMALDEVLLRLVERPLLRVYQWESTCVTFGYFQKYELVEELYPQQQLVRRWSGGGCVEHGEDFTFSLMIPESEGIGQQAPSLFYRKLHEAIVVTLQEHGLKARLAAQEDQVSGESCFVAPCPCDVMLEQTKIVGGAQRRSEGNLLYQGSLNLGARRRELQDGKSFFLSLAKQLSPTVTAVEENDTWLKEGDLLSRQKYRLEGWQRRR